MKRFLILVAALTATAPLLAADVGVSISIGQPGFYGRLDIGDYPPPQLIYRQPRYLYRSAATRAPIYLHVAPGHAQNWRRHCRAYGACGERVYFVRDEWYQREFIPRYQERRGDRRDGRMDDRRDGRRDGRHDGRGNDRDPHDRRGGNRDYGPNR